MNLLDIIIGIPLAYFIYKGWKRGLIFELATLAGIVVGCYAASRFSTLLVDLLHLEGEAAIVIAFFILFVGVLLLSVVLGKAVEGFVKLVKVGWANNVLGSLFGMLKALCVVSVLLNLLTIVDHEATLVTVKTREKSILYTPTVKTGDRLTYHLRQVVEQAHAKQ